MNDLFLNLRGFLYLMATYNDDGLQDHRDLGARLAAIYNGLRKELGDDFLALELFERVVPTLIAPPTQFLEEDDDSAPE